MVHQGRGFRIECFLSGLNHEDTFLFTKELATHTNSSGVQSGTCTFKLWCNSCLKGLKQVYSRNMGRGQGQSQGQRKFISPSEVRVYQCCSKASKLRVTSSQALVYMYISGGRGTVSLGYRYLFYNDVIPKCMQ